MKSTVEQLARNIITEQKAIIVQIQTLKNNNNKLRQENKSLKKEIEFLRESIREMKRHGEFNE